jgi:hypothetical protein
MLTEFQLLSFDAMVGDGVTGSQFVSIGGIAKRFEGVPFVAANEFVANRIAAILGIPVAPGYLLKIPSNEVYFINVNFNPTGTNLPPVRPPELVKKLPRICAGVVIFDILIGNPDRHPRNLAHFDKKQQLAVFDHSHSLFGISPGYGASRLTWLNQSLGCIGEQEPFGLTGNRHCLIDHIPESGWLLEWLERVRLIPDYFFEDVCNDVLQVTDITRAEADSLREYLVKRRNGMSLLLTKHQDQFTALTQWGIV